MNEAYILIDGEPEIEKCPECESETLYIFKLTAMNDEGVGGMESTIRRCLHCAKEDE